MRRARSASYVGFLKLLIEKRKEQTALFYTRLNIFLAVSTALLGGATALIAGGYRRLPLPGLFALVALICALGGALSIAWLFVMRSSAKWIDYWQAKTIRFEARYAVSEGAAHFFLDRLQQPGQIPPMQNGGTRDHGQVRWVNDALGWARGTRRSRATRDIALIAQLVVGAGAVFWVLVGWAALVLSVLFMLGSVAGLCQT